ncbi:MAG: hypothetical protein V1932_03455 [Chloroflexota bacterium]
MSKFIDKLNKLHRAEAQPIGFRIKQPVSPKPKIQLVASLAEENAESLAGNVAGADAGLLCLSHMNAGIKILQNISQAMPDIPWGVWLKGSGQGKVEQTMKAGGDFVVFPATNTPLSKLHTDEVGKILEVEASLTEGLLRTANELPVDAVLIASEEKEDYFLTWRHLMLFQRFAGLLNKPLLVSVPAKVTAGELQALWEAGVDGIVVEVKIGQPQDKLKELHQVIDKLTYPAPRRNEKVRAILPRIGREAGEVSEEEGEEE